MSVDPPPKKLTLLAKCYDSVIWRQPDGKRVNRPLAVIQYASPRPCVWCYPDTHWTDFDEGDHSEDCRGPDRASLENETTYPLLSLPVELILLIAKQLPTIHDLNRLSRVNRFTHALLTPLLYQVVAKWPADSTKYGSLLYYAIFSSSRSNEFLVRRLLEAGADVNQTSGRSSSGNSMLQQAIRSDANSHHRMALLLLAYGTKFTSKDGNLLAQFAPKRWSEPLFRAILEKYVEDDPTDSLMRRKEALEKAAKVASDTAIQLLLPTVPPELCSEALHEAVDRGYLPNVQRLLDHGADVNSLDKRGLPLIGKLCGPVGPRRHILCYLLDNCQINLNLRASDYSPLSHWYTSYSSTGGPRDGRTALHFAAYVTTDIFNIKKLLEKGDKIDINALDGRGYTPVLYAAERVAFRPLQELLRAGADPNPNPKSSIPNFTALHALAHWLKTHHRAEAIKCIKLLAKYGARRDIRDDSGRTPFDIALLERDEEGQKLLM